MAYEDRIMRMAGSVPQRTVRPTMRDVAGPGTNYNKGYGPGDVAISNLPAVPRAGGTPIQMGESRGEFSPPLYSGRNPFIQPIQTGGREGEFSGTGIFGGKNPRSFAANDMMSDYYNNQLGWGDQLQSAIGGAGEVTPTQYTDDDKAIQRGLWKQANKNVNPEGMTPMPQIIQEWERLQEEYWRLKAQGYRPGE